MNNRFVLGTVQFGLHYGINNTEGKPAEEKVFELLEYAHVNGITELDTAAAYGNAEQLLGKFFKSNEKKFSVNTKFHVDGNLEIPAQLSQSLEQLHLSDVNVYFYHRLADMLSAPGSLQVLAELRKQGLIKSIGVSVYTNEEFKAAINEDLVDVIQLPFNLLDNNSKRGQLITEAKQKGKTLQARSVFLQGLFFKNEENIPASLQPLVPYIKKLKAMAATKHLSMFDLALGYVLSQPDIDKVIIGVDSQEQLQANLNVNLNAFDESLKDEINTIQVKEEALLYPYNWK